LLEYHIQDMSICTKNVIVRPKGKTPLRVPLWCKIHSTEQVVHMSRQARNQLGSPGGAKSFLRGAQIFLNFVQ